jgi:hypothetical protein
VTVTTQENAVLFEFRAEAFISDMMNVHQPMIVGVFVAYSASPLVA